MLKLFTPILLLSLASQTAFAGVTLTKPERQNLLELQATCDSKFRSLAITEHNTEPRNVGINTCLIDISTFINNSSLNNDRKPTTLQAFGNHYRNKFTVSTVYKPRDKKSIKTYLNVLDNHTSQVFTAVRTLNSNFYMGLNPVQISAKFKENGTNRLTPLITGALDDGWNRFNSRADVDTSINELEFSLGILSKDKRFPLGTYNSPFLRAIDEMKRENGVSTYCENAFDRNICKLEYHTKLDKIANKYNLVSYQ